MKFLSKYFNGEATPDPKVEALPVKRITTDFYRIVNLGGGVVVNSRMYAFKQDNGRMGIRVDMADTGLDPLTTPNLLPDRIAGWFLPKEDKNLTLEQAITRLEEYVSSKTSQGQTERDFSTPKKELSIAQAKTYLAPKV